MYPEHVKVDIIANLAHLEQPHTLTIGVFSSYQIKFKDKSFQIFQSIGGRRNESHKKPRSQRQVRGGSLNNNTSTWQALSLIRQSDGALSNVRRMLILVTAIY